MTFPQSLSKIADRVFKTLLVLYFKPGMGYVLVCDIQLMIILITYYKITCKESIKSLNMLLSFEMIYLFFLSEQRSRNLEFVLFGQDVGRNYLHELPVGSLLPHFILARVLGTVAVSPPQGTSLLLCTLPSFPSLALGLFLLHSLIPGVSAKT